MIMTEEELKALADRVALGEEAPGELESFLVQTDKDLHELDLEMGEVSSPDVDSEKLIA